MPDTGWPNHPGPQCDCAHCAYQRAYPRPQPIQPNQVPNAFMSGFGGCLGVGLAILVVIAVVIVLAVGCAAYATHSNQNNNRQPSSTGTGAAGGITRSLLVSP